VAEEAAPVRYRSTPSWPPPPRPRIAVGILGVLVAAVMVALLVTNGRVGRPGRTTTTVAQNRPALRTDPAAVPADWIAHRDSQANFGISYPPTWTVREEGTVLSVRDPATGAELRIDHGIVRGDVDPQRTWIDLERSFAAQHASDYRRLQLSPATYLGHPAALWEFTYAERDVAVHAVDLGFTTKNRRFALYFQAPASEWQRMLPVFSGFLSSFQAPK
jgi:hypothetical protein